MSTTKTVTSTLTNTVKEAASRTGLSERSIWQAITDRKLNIVRVGSRVLIPEEALRTFLGLKSGSGEGAE
ncbi:MAG: excisionase family DNA-binding protein [Candidatus Korobacteraceae bacterium]|jgi:excisionase family DNA binding protein